MMRVTEKAHWLEWQDWADPILQRPYEIKDGLLHVPDVPGIGLEWNEGVEVGGDYGPYRQTERLHIYRAHAVELMAKGHAYHCFCSPQQLEDDRQTALREGRPPQYVGRCREIPRADARRRVENGEPAAIRFRVPMASGVAAPTPPSSGGSVSTRQVIPSGECHAVASAWLPLRAVPTAMKPSSLDTTLRIQPRSTPPGVSIRCQVSPSSDVQMSGAKSSA